MAPPDQTAALHARIAELEAENARLRASQTSSDATRIVVSLPTHGETNGSSSTSGDGLRGSHQGMPSFHLNGHSGETTVEASYAELSESQALWNRWTLLHTHAATSDGVLDIQATVRRQAELLAHVRDSIVCTDLRGIITGWNHRAENTYGYSAAEALGKHISLIFGDVDLLEPLLRDGRFEIELNCRRKSGEDCFLHLVLSLLRDESEQPSGMFALAIDITGHKQLEEALRDSEARLSLAQRSAEMGTWDWNIIADTCVWSEGMAPLFGLPSGESVGSFRALLPLVEPEDRPALLSAVTEASTSRSEYYVEFRVRWPDGSLHWLSGKGSVYFNSAGQPARMIGLAADITSRKRTEEALLNAEHRFKTALKNSPVVVFNQDRELRYTWIHNPFLGMAPEQILGKRDIDIFERQEDAERTEALKRRVLESGIGDRQEVLFRHQGSEHYYDLTVEPIRSLRGTIEGVTCAASDITEQKRTEAKLAKRAVELAGANADLQNFAYALAHDLNEPVRTILSFTQLIRNNYRGTLDANADEFLEFIFEAGERMKLMISELTNYFRITSAPGGVETRVSLETVLETSLANLRAGIEETNATITHDPLPIVFATSSQLVHVFQNLIGNALKYHKASEPILVHVSAQARDADWLISVSDNGIGFSPASAESIFKIFKRLHADEYPGAGMGLAICKRIVEGLGGRIWATSTPGVGSTFSFTLPR